MLIPLWAFITLQSIAGLLALLALTLIARAWLRRKDLQTRRCYRCHYDLSATSGLKCPECGHEAKSESELLGQRRRWRSTRRAFYAITIAGTICFLGFAAAWPIPMMPSWLLIRLTPWLMQLSPTSAESTLDELRNTRTLTREQFADLIIQMEQGWRQEPVPIWPKVLLDSLLWNTMAAPDRRSMIPKGEYSAPIEPATACTSLCLLTDAERIELTSAILDADTRSILRMPRLAERSYALAFHYGDEYRSWLLSQYFAPTSDWITLQHLLQVAMRSDNLLLLHVFDRFDSGTANQRGQAAALLSEYRHERFRSASGSTMDAAADLRLAALAAERDRLRQPMADLITCELHKLEQPGVLTQIAICRMIQFRGGEPWTAKAVQPLKNLSQNSTSAEVRQAAANALDTLARAQPELAEEINAAPAPPPPSPR